MNVALGMRTNNSFPDWPAKGGNSLYTHLKCLKNSSGFDFRLIKVFSPEIKNIKIILVINILEFSITALILINGELVSAIWRKVHVSLLFSGTWLLSSCYCLPGKKSSQAANSSMDEYWVLLTGSKSCSHTKLFQVVLVSNLFMVIVNC